MSDTTKLSADVSDYVSGMEKAAKYTSLLEKSMVTAGITSARFNETGKIIDATFEGITSSGEKIIIQMEKVEKGFEVAAISIKKSIDGIKKEQERLLDDKFQKKTAENLATFRRTVGQPVQRSIFPKGGKSTDYRTLFGDLDQLEAYIKRGEVSAARAKKIITDIQSGTSTRITKNKFQEDFRQDALKLFSDAERLRSQFQQRTARALGGSLSAEVPNRLDAQFGKLLPSVATPGQLAQVEAAYQRIQKIVSTGTVPSDRLNDLIAKYAKGVADPVNLAERQIVAGLKRIDDAFKGAQERANNAASEVQRAKDALDVGAALKSGSAGYLGGLNPADLERTYAQINKIQNLISSGKLSKAQFSNVFDGIKSGAKQNFQGAEEQARAAITKIRNIIQGNLSSPFEVNISFNRATSLLHKLITANFAVELLEKFKDVVTEAAEYQRQVALIQTITQDANLSFNQWAEGIKRVSDELGKPIGEIAAAGYDLLSNQVTKAADTFDVLGTAAQFARITNSRTEDSGNLLSTALNTFRLNESDAEKVAAQFFTVIDLGRVKAAGLANSGRTFEFGKTVGASIEEINASIITLTQSGIKEDNALTLLNNVFQKLLNPTKELQVLYDKLGVSTGESFVKTYGFTGALQKLKEETGGSSAKLSDFFNEIRGFQGIDNLISRLDIFQDALHQLGEAPTRVAEAKKKFNNLPGQQFLEQTNKVKNLFVTGFQTGILNTVLGLTHTFGDLDELVIKLTSGVTALTAATAGYIALLKAGEGLDYFEKMYKWALLNEGGLTKTAFAAKGLGTALQAIGPYAATVAAAAAIGEIGIAALEAKERIEGMYEELITEQNRLNKIEEDSDQKRRNTQLDEYQKKLKDGQQGILSYFATAKQALNAESEQLDKIGEKLRDNLKNSLELSLKSAKGALQALVSQQEAALKSIADIKREKVDLQDSRGSDLFHYALAKDQSATGGANERKIYQQRLDQLTKLQHQATRRGDLGAQKKYFDEKKALINELATARDSNNNLKYYGAEEAIRNLYREENQLLNQQARIKAKLAFDQEKQIKALSADIKTAEDADKALYSFRLTDEHTGKAKYKSHEEAEAELRHREEDSKKAHEAIERNTAFRRGPYNSTDAAVAAKLDADRRRQVAEDFQKFYGHAHEAAGSIDKNTKLDDYRDKTFAEFEAQSHRARDLEKAATESQQEYNRARAVIKTEAGELLGRDRSLHGRLGIYTTDEVIGIGHPETDASKQRDKLLTDFQRNINAGLFNRAQENIGGLRDLYKKHGALNSTYGGGPNNEQVTIDEGLKRFQAHLNTAREAYLNYSQNSKAFEKVTGSPQQAFQDITKLFEKYGDVATKAKQLEGQKAAAIQGLTAIDDLFEAVGKTLNTLATSGAAMQVIRTQIQNEESTPTSHSMGGDIGHYDQGGDVPDWSSRGIDTQPALLSPSEFVMNPQSSRRFHAQLVAMNSGFDSTPPRSTFAQTTVGDIHVSVNGGNTSQQTIKEIAAGIRRELRRGTIQLGNN